MAKTKGTWPKAVFTDSKNTLFAWDTVWVRACSGILRKYGSSIDPEDFRAQWSMFMAGENFRVAFGKYRKFTESLRISLAYTFKFFGIQGSPDDVTFMTDLWKEVQPFPDTRDGLVKLKEMTKVLIYSNVETEYLDSMMANLTGFEPHFVGDMDKSTFSKPSPRAYRWVLETAGRALNMEIDYPDVLYVAGPQWDVQGAMALGMKGCWIHRPYRHTPEPQGMPYDYEVKDFHEVAGIVEASLA
jgi:2-haloalkanoic acid dehalogenase type II